MKNFTILLLTLLVSVLSTTAQNFMPGFDIFSHKMPAYLTLNDGTKVEGEIDKLNRKRNNISGIKMVINGKDIEYAPEEVKEMYLPANKLNKFSLKYDNALNTSKDYDLDVINEGYGYFENTEVEFGGKVQTLMMQLVNPSSANKITVYFDPMAMQTMSVGIGPISTGGIDRSYYIKTSEGTAFKISKANIKKVYKELFEDCPSLLKEIGKKPNWKVFDEYVFAHAHCN
jgi:hypothetical protein